MKLLENNILIVIAIIVLLLLILINVNNKEGFIDVETINGLVIKKYDSDVNGPGFANLILELMLSKEISDNYKYNLLREGHLLGHTYMMDFNSSLINNYKLTIQVSDINATVIFIYILLLLKTNSSNTFNALQISKKYISQSTNNNIYELINNYKTVNDFDKDKFAKDLTDIIGGYDYYMQYKDKSYNTMPLK
jgi:hypothetical protein